MEGRDIDAGLTQYRRKTADEARLVRVGDVDHRSTELRVHPDALDVDDARAAVGEDGAGNMPRLPAGRDGDGNEAFVIALRLARDFLDHDTAILGNHRRRTHVYILQHRAQQASDGG